METYYDRLYTEVGPLNADGAIRLASDSEISEVLQSILKQADALVTSQGGLPSETRKSLEFLSLKYKPSGESSQRPPSKSSPILMKTPPLSGQIVTPPAAGVNVVFTGSNQKLVTSGKQFALSNENL